MRKIALWFLSTLTVVVLALGYRTSTEGTLSTAAPPAIISGGSSSATTPSASTPEAGGSATSPKRQRSTPRATAKTVTGAVAATQWGPVQVRLSVSSGTITDVSVVQYPSGNPRDDEINSVALPQLIQETLDAQSAQIDMVSGATVTSSGYLQSLQSAIDQAGL